MAETVGAGAWGSWPQGSSQMIQMFVKDQRQWPWTCLNDIINSGFGRLHPDHEETPKSETS